MSARRGSQGAPDPGGQRAEQAREPSSPGRVAAGLTASWLAVSSAAVVIVLAAPVPPLSIAAIRTAITAVIWVVIGRLSSHRARAAQSGSEEASSPAASTWPWGRIVFSGLLLGLHFGLWVASLFMTSVPHAAVLVGLQPLFAGVFGRMLGDRATWRLPAGVAVALIGTRLMTETDAEGVTLMGDSFAVLAAACSAGYLTVNRGMGDRVPLPSLLFLVNGVAALSLALAVILFGDAVFWPAEAGAKSGWAILWLGLGPGLIGHGLMNWAARSVPVHVVSMTILLEPIGAALLAWFVLGQTVAGLEAAGAVLLIIGAGLTLERAE